MLNAPWTPLSEQQNEKRPRDVWPRPNTSQGIGCRVSCRKSGTRKFIHVHHCLLNCMCGWLFFGSIASTTAFCWKSCLLSAYRARRWWCSIAMVMSDDAIELVLQKWAWAKGEEAAMKLSYVKWCQVLCRKCWYMGVLSMMFCWPLAKFKVYSIFLVF